MLHGVSTKEVRHRRKKDNACKITDIMKRIGILTLIILYTVVLHAQNFTLKGIVLDKSKQPVSYVSVALLASDSTTLVTGAISDDKGQFQLSNIKAGKYCLSLSFIGFKPLKEKIVVNADIERSFVLDDDAVALNEVVVKTNRSNIIKQSAAGQTFML